MFINKIENKENVKQITMHPTACTLCQLGQDWFTNNFEIKFEPNKYYPDYMQVEQYISENVDGKELNIEQAGRLVYDFLLQYEPNNLIVINHVRNCKTHFDVDVIIYG